MSKAELRARIRAARSERPEQARGDAAGALARQVLPLLPERPGTVAVYLSMPAEPGTGPLIDAVLAAGHRVVAPRITAAGLEWVPLDAGSSLEPGPLGIREPTAPALPDGALGGADLVLLPGLAVDGRGTRLGQGGGYYDRALAGVASHADGGPLRVVVLFDDEVLDAVPSEPHDCRVDAALTPGGVIALG